MPSTSTPKSPAPTTVTPSKPTGTKPAALDPAWIAADAESARAAILAAGASAVSLVEVWVDRGNAAPVAALANDEDAPGPARKAARRGLNVLKSRGVPIPEQHRVARLATAASIEGYDAWFLAPDATGTWILLVVARSTGGGHHFVEVVARELVGVVQIRSTDMSRSQLDAYFERVKGQLGFGHVAVDVAWARARVAAARATNAKSGAIMPLGWDQNADVLEPTPTTEPPHPIDAAGIEPSDPAAASARSLSLHGEPEFRTWLPDDGAIGEMLGSLGAKLGPSPDPEKIDVPAILKEAVADATDRFFNPDVREALVQRMKDAAISILARAGQSRAAEVLGTMKAIQAAGLVTSPPREIPFLRAFFDKALALLAAQRGGKISVPITKGASPGSPLGAPGEIDDHWESSTGDARAPESVASEAAERAAAEGARVSPGGIILP